MKKTGKNRYFTRSRISERKFREIIRLFSADLTAVQIAFITKINRTTINKTLQKVRIRIAEFCERESNFVKNYNDIKNDETYFWPRRVRGKREHRAKNKTIVFCMKKREGKVYTQIIANCSKKLILPMTKYKTGTPATLFTNGFKTYDGLVNFGYKKHYRIHQGKNESSNVKVNLSNEEPDYKHINSIENFWSIAKVRLYKFRGMNKNTFHLHLKECEFRFNYRQKNIYKMILDMLRKSPLNQS